MKKIAALILSLLVVETTFSDEISVHWLYSWIPFTYTVPEGSVGIFFRGGFYNKVYEPGIHSLFSWPITKGMRINVRPQIDIIENIPCGTMDGLTIIFPRIAVYNQLHKDEVLNIVSNFGEEYDHYLITEPTIQAVTELCTTMTAQEIYIDKFPAINDFLLKHLIEEQGKSHSKLKVNKVVVSKPVLPENIKRNYEVIVEEKSKLVAVSQTQARKLKEAETQQLERSKKADTDKMVAAIENEKKLAEEKNKMELEKIRVAVRVHQLREDAEAEAFILRQKGEAEAYVIKISGEARANATLQEAIANERLITPLYVQLKQTEAFWRNNNSKLIYFGEKIPKSVYPGFIDSKDIKNQ
ncbi:MULTISPECIES: SPFH domain-containing protein [unclassified Endozoicomonas]|uniref:SPFH domain-containing protein n=1 Tax=unclassified Endozoicomonas TaxID=2644528 RepID=UPI002149702D|nr:MULTISPECIES: SPFH domain-containing protein [unclassified Endozoicomonas]